MTLLKQSDQCTQYSACWHPLLPAFSARIIFALRTLLGITCCAIFTFSPVTSKLLQDQFLLSVAFIVTLKSTLGATIRAVSRLFLAAIISTIYCIFIINLFPKNIYFAVGSTNLFVLIIVYTDLPIIVRRFSILTACIILLQWFNKPYINTLYVFHIWASLSIGSALAIIVLCIPFPLFPTAYRELTMRMKFVAQQIRIETTGIIILISEHDDTHLNNNSNNKYSTSFKNLKDDHLLSSDIQDLHLLINDELKYMKRTLTDISFEPYFILLKILNIIKKIFYYIPFLRNFIKITSTLQSRLEIWTICFISLHRTITGILSLDHHHHAFVGQRQLINAIYILLDSTFNFLDSTLPYTISSSNSINTAHTISCRKKIDEALEHFFEIYAQMRENPSHSDISNINSIHLNTFLLLILRLVHVIITTAETSDTPGVNHEQTINSLLKIKLFNWKNLLYNLFNYIGLKPTFGKFLRAIKTSLSVFISAIIVLTYRERLQAYNWVYWAPMTTVLVSDSSEGSTLRLSFQLLIAVLFGSTYAYIIIILAQNNLLIGIFICLFISLMAYIKCDFEKEYFADVCAQSASIITFLSNQEGLHDSNKAVLARTSLTFLGIFIHVFISNIFLPTSARELIKKKVLIMMNNVLIALKSVNEDFCVFINSTTINPILIKQDMSKFMNTLSETENIIDNFPILLEEALNEPNFWKRPFIEVKDYYDDISKTLRRIIHNIRFIHRCTTILKAEIKLHFAQDAKWQIRRGSMAPSYNTDRKASQSSTINDLYRQKQLQNDLDIPLTIFMTYSPRSSISIRLPNTELYQPVLQHIFILEKHIEQVILLVKELIEKQATVNIGSVELQQLHHKDSFIAEEDKEKKNFRIQISNRRPSFYPIRKFKSIPILKNSYKYFPCCINIDQEKDNEPLPSLRNTVDIMFTSLIEFLHANNHFIRTELISTKSIGDILAFHTLSYAFKDMAEAITNLAKNVRRIKHIDTRTLIHTESDEKNSIVF